MRSPHVLFIPVGRASFDQEAAREVYEASVTALRSAGLTVTEPGKILMMPEDCEAFCRAQPPGADLAIFQTTTFIDARFVVAAAGAISAPMHLWSVPEPVADGGRLKRNSLTGANLAGQALTAIRRSYGYTNGAPDQPAVMGRIAARARAAALAADLRSLRVGVVGEAPPGFFNSGADELELRRVLGTQVEHINLYQMLDLARETADASAPRLIDEARSRMSGIDDLPVVEVSRSLGFYEVLARHARQQGLEAMAIRCWPDSFEQIGAAACTAVSRLTDEGVVAACEADIHGAISMWVGSRLTGSPTYLGDLVHTDDEQGSAVFWHCGAAAYSLVSPRTGAVAGVHPNRKLALTLEVGLKPGRVTMLRLAPGPGGYRLLVAGGEALDAPQRFWGTTVEIRTDTPVAECLERIVLDGFDHHFAIAWGDIRAELKDLGQLLGIKVTML